MIVDHSRLNISRVFQPRNVYLAKDIDFGTVKTVIVTSWTIEDYENGVIFIDEEGSITYGSLEYLERAYVLVSKVNKLILE